MYQKWSRITNMQTLLNVMDHWHFAWLSVTFATQKTNICKLWESGLYSYRTYMYMYSWTHLNKFFNHLYSHMLIFIKMCSKCFWLMNKMKILLILLILKNLSSIMNYSCSTAWCIKQREQWACTGMPTCSAHYTPLRCKVQVISWLEQTQAQCGAI